MQRHGIYEAWGMEYSDYELRIIRVRRIVRCEVNRSSLKSLVSNTSIWFWKLEYTTVSFCETNWTYHSSSLDQSDWRFAVIWRHTILASSYRRFISYAIIMIAPRKAGGFIIPQRTMTQMFFSACNGVISLISEKTRIGFIDSLEKGIIQEGVLSQATAGPMMMLSLFHDLQNPLFKKNKFG